MSVERGAARDWYKRLEKLSIAKIQVLDHNKDPVLQTDKIMKQKETRNKIVTRGSGANNVANVKWAKGTKEGNKGEKGEKESK